MITEGMTYEISNLYENTFPKLTEQYFDNTPWPHEDEVSPLVDNDPVSVITTLVLAPSIIFQDHHTLTWSVAYCRVIAKEPCHNE